MAKEFQRKLYVIELREDNDTWILTRFGEYQRESLPKMREELKKARAQYPDSTYKITTYVPVIRMSEARIATSRAEKAKRRRR